MRAKIENGAVKKFPYSISDLRADNPNVSFPKNMSKSMLEGWGVYEVQRSIAPPYDARVETIQLADTPVLKDGFWQLQWNIAQKAPHEVEKYDANIAGNVRQFRDQLLEDSDILALREIETTGAVSVMLREYRQSLRDITSHANFPYLAEADWPVKP